MGDAMMRVANPDDIASAGERQRRSRRAGPQPRRSSHRENVRTLAPSRTCAAMSQLRHATAASLTAFLLAATLHAANWPQWRGPDGQGISSEAALPSEWTPTKNIAWKTPIAGRGHSSPIVWGNYVFLTTAVEGEVILGAKAPIHYLQE